MTLQDFIRIEFWQQITFISLLLTISLIFKYLVYRAILLNNRKEISGRPALILGVISLYLFLQVIVLCINLVTYKEQAKLKYFQFQKQNVQVKK